MPTGNGKTLSKEAQAELRRQLDREKESDEQKWVRSAIRDEVRDAISELFGSGEDDDGSSNGTRSSKPRGFLDGFLGQKG